MSEVNCPYCDHPQKIDHDDGYGYSEDEIHNQQCGECDKYFTFTTSIDEDAEINRVISTIVSPTEYLLFINEKVNYRTLIQSSDFVFITDRNDNDDLIAQYRVPTKEIPEEYLPEEGFVLNPTPNDTRK